MSFTRPANAAPITNPVVDRLITQPLSAPTSSVSAAIVTWYLKTAAASVSR